MPGLSASDNKHCTIASADTSGSFLHLHSKYQHEAKPEIVSLEGCSLVDHSRIVYLDSIAANEIAGGTLYCFVKRLFDIIASIAALVMMAIPMVIMALKIHFDSEGPVLFKQERLGLGGGPFVIYKFRSMYQDAEDDGAQWTKNRDDRITPYGKRLRESRLDEVPQFVNVLKGTCR